MTKIEYGTSNAGVQLTPEWYRWLVENMLALAPAQSIVNSMMESGFTERAATDAVNAALEDPHLRAAAELGLGKDPSAATPVVAPSNARQEKYAWILEVARRNAKLAPSWGTVDRVHKPTVEEFLENYYSKNRPCIITGAIDDWPALTKWTGDYLKEKCGDQIVEIQANRNSDENYELESARFKSEVPFRDVIDQIENAGETNDVYVTANNGGRNKTALRALWDDITFPPYLDGSDPNNDGFFWYGPKGVVTPMHHDLTNNFMAMVRGRKLVRIIAPWETADVYNNIHCFSPVDIMNPDYEKHPKMRNVDILDVEIGPGELFFLPVGWWHGVRGLDLTITMTFTNVVFPNDFYSFYTTEGEI